MSDNTTPTSNDTPLEPSVAAKLKELHDAINSGPPGKRNERAREALHDELDPPAFSTNTVAVLHLLIDEVFKEKGQ